MKCSLLSRIALLSFAACVVASPLAYAQITPATGYDIGTSFTAVADPTVPRPSTTPCIVNLFTEVEFNGEGNVPFNFTPPAACPGPYSKIVLVGDYTVTGGIQYDRTSQIFFNNVDLFFGTTPEPTDPVLSDPWHVERDITDYASLFSAPGTGFALLANYTNSTDNSVQYGTANVYFYPADGKNPPAHSTADTVIPLLTAAGGTAQLNAGAPEADTTVTLPTNLKKLFMDVFAEAQNAEEQWFTCSTADAAPYISYDACPNTPFREVEVSIDGVPAGVAPVSPWIYTGGVDPYLWFPIPGAQTLNFKSYRVDLSPFAGLVSDGQPHTFGVAVYNVYEYFNVAAALLGYRDAGSKTTSGTILRNTLTAPNPVVTENLTTSTAGVVSGTVSVTSNRSYVISGTVKTSKGTIVNSVASEVHFANYTSGSGDDETFVTQQLKQESSVDTTHIHGDDISFSHWEFPIDFSASFVINADGGYSSTAAVNQHWLVAKDPPAGLVKSSVKSNDVQASDSYLVVACAEGYCLNAAPDQKSSQRFYKADADGGCYYQGLQAALNVLTAETTLPFCASEYSGNQKDSTARPAAKTFTRQPAASRAADRLQKRFAEQQALRAAGK